MYGQIAKSIAQTSAQLATAAKYVSNSLSRNRPTTEVRDEVSIFFLDEISSINRCLEKLEHSDSFKNSFNQIEVLLTDAYKEIYLEKDKLTIRKSSLDILNLLAPGESKKYQEDTYLIQERINTLALKTDQLLWNVLTGEFNQKCYGNIEKIASKAAPKYQKVIGIRKIYF